MLDPIINQNAFLIRSAQTSMADLADERIAEQPLPDMNHPAWILGHMAWAGDAAVGMLGGNKTLDGHWKDRYGMGSKPTSVRTDYPSKDELLATLEERYAEARRLASTASGEQLSEPTSNPRLKETMPTMRDFVGFLLTGHVAIHLGQLSAWRRAIGIPPRL